MAKRVQVQDLRTTDRLSPQARPVDTFASPIIDAPNVTRAAQLSQLGQALGRFEPSLTRYLHVKSEKQKEQDLIQAEADAMANRQGLKKVTKDGLLREGHNPWYVHGYMKRSNRRQWHFRKTAS